MREAAGRRIGEKRLVQPRPLPSPAGLVPAGVAESCSACSLCSAAHKHM